MGVLTGIVSDSTTGGRLIKATIHVLGTEYFGETNIFGRYRIEDLPVGRYAITFSHTRIDLLGFSPPTFVVEVRGGETTELPLYLPSMAAILTAGCGRLPDGPGALTGYIREWNQLTELPQADVRLSWPQVGDTPAGNVQGFTDIDGIYRFCDVPVGVPVVVEAAFMGLSVRTSGLVLAPGEARQHDFEIAVVGVDKKAVQLSREGRERLAEGETDVQGRIRDFESEQPIDGALVRVRNHDELAITDPYGRFVLHDVQAGIRVLDVEHLAYGNRTSEVLLTRGGASDVDVSMRRQAIALEPMVVTARKRVRLDPRVRDLGTRKDVMAREQIADVEGFTRHAGDLLRRFPGITVTEETTSTGGYQLCIRRGRGGSSRSNVVTAGEMAGAPKTCDTLPVFMDGRPMFDPEIMLATVPITDIESIELVTSTSAAAYPGAQNGAIVIYTRGNGPWANGKVNRP